MKHLRVTVRRFTAYKHLAEKLISDLQRRRDLEAAPQARKFCGFLDTKSRFSLFFTLWNALRWLLGKAIIDPTPFQAHYQRVLKCFHKGIVKTLAK